MIYNKEVIEKEKLKIIYIKSTEYMNYYYIIINNTF